MKCRYTFPVTGNLCPDETFPFEIDGLRYEFNQEKSGFVTAVGISFDVSDKSQWPKFGPSSMVGTKATIRGSSPRLPEIKQQVRVIAGLLAPHGLQSINLNEPRQEWIPENDREKAELQVYSFQSKTGHLPRDQANTSPFSFVIASIIGAKQAVPFEAALSFLRRGYLDMESWAYIDAFYDFYFMLERLYGNGKTKNVDVEREFLSNPILVKCVKDVSDDPETARFFLADPECVTPFQTKYQGRNSEEILKSIVKLRGFLHHQSSKRQDGWHPEDQGHYRTDAILLQMICLSVFFAVTNPCVFSTEAQERGRIVWEKFRPTACTPSVQKSSDDVQPIKFEEKTKSQMHKRLTDFFEAAAERRTMTLLFTTDGKRCRIIDSLHPLAPSYLDKWERDCRESKLDRKWGGQ
jgi:hypothetical protein